MDSISKPSWWDAGLRVASTSHLLTQSITCSWRSQLAMVFFLSSTPARRRKFHDSGIKQDGEKRSFLLQTLYSSFTQRWKMPGHFRRVLLIYSIIWSFYRLTCLAQGWQLIFKHLTTPESRRAFNIHFHFPATVLSYPNTAMSYGYTGLDLQTQLRTEDWRTHLPLQSCVCCIN